jgi:Reverse transcriptase (RNA-dependent DNA polymerase)
MEGSLGGGFTQRYGIDYTETFSGVVRAAAFRVIFALAAYFDLEIEQLDVQTAFLYRDLEEAIYAEQLHGFEEGPRDKSEKFGA